MLECVPAQLLDMRREVDDGHGPAAAAVCPDRSGDSATGCACGRRPETRSSATGCGLRGPRSGCRSSNRGSRHAAGQPTCPHDYCHARGDGDIDPHADINRHPRGYAGRDSDSDSRAYAQSHAGADGYFDPDSYHQRRADRYRSSSHTDETRPDADT